jgi:hypothetical protein
MGAVKAEKNGLYDRDFYSWALEQSDALREHRTEALDWENLAEEVGDLARNERRAFRSQCARLVEHLLKFAFAPPAEIKRNPRLWRLTLLEARSELSDLLMESPGLRPAIADLFAAGWRSGRLKALQALDCLEEALPKDPLWSFEQAIDENFIPRKADVA